MEVTLSFRCLSNADLTTTVLHFAQNERHATALLIAALAEFDQRRLYLDHGFTSLHAYCREILHLSEHAAYGRIEAARIARKFPCLLGLLQDGSLTLTNLCLLSQHLTPANHQALLKEAAHKRKEDVQRIVARLRPLPDVPSVVRKLPAPTLTSSLTSAADGRSPERVESGPERISAAPALLPPAKPAVIAPLAPERYKIQITVDQETRDVLRQAQDLMRHSNPGGDPAVVISRALRVLVDDLLKKKSAQTQRPGRTRVLADGSRAIPAPVKREVWKRDGGRCAFDGPRGRCNTTDGIEYHHVIPYALGGEATADNIELRCRAHNAYQARLDELGWDQERRNTAR